MKRNLHILVYLLSMLWLNCQFPFSTRDPEKPSSTQSSWIQPTAPEYVLINLKNALAEKNSTNYLRCLADTSISGQSFRYHADPSVANAYPNLFDRWNKLSETNYVNQLMLFLKPDSVVKLTLSASKSIDIGDINRITLVQDYQLDVRHTCKETDCPRLMAGQSELILGRNTESLWAIVEWTDRSSGETPTWSQLRAYFGK
ncbi:MAG TPA: hypothetical protein PKN04_00705 [bacterium]|nr:hypothetical protein [bacterium]HNT64278.1 hypothetical protein [bacterium]HOX85268.1 hypothetical protein [bacterium]HPG44427.1 hypothetical protein [bacterium]HPM96985.1 hypothetical protein [bacterium]